MPVSAKLNASVPIADLETAAKTIKEHIQADAARVPDLDVALGALSGKPALHRISYTDTPSDAWLPFLIRKTVQLPPALLDELNVVPQACGMDLLPEIHCAYITMNHQLYLWDYSAGSEFLRYEEQPNNITSVALVRPKAGIFIDAIEWLLVIATKANLLLLGLSKDAATGEIKLYQTDMSVPTDGDMDNIVGTQDGRVFMTGVEDGNLYELLYQVEEGWFTKKIRLNNLTIGALQNILPSLFSYKQSDKIVLLAVDDERHYLYAYTQTNYSITVYSLGQPGSNQFAPIGVVSSLFQAIHPLLPPNPSARKFVSKDGFGVLSLHVVPRAESRSICLIAVTFTGLRIYLSDGRASLYGGGFRAIHLRFPPPQTETSNLGEVAQSACTNGAFVCAYAPDQATDSNPIVAASVDMGSLIKAQASAATAGGPGLVTAPGHSTSGLYNPYPAQRVPLYEYSDAFQVAGRTWALKRLIKASSITRSATTPSIYVTGSSYPSALNSLVTQFTEPPDQFAVLSNVALSFVVRKRPSDILKGIIDSDAGVVIGGAPGQTELSSFSDSFGRDETCAQLLALAAGNSFLSPEACEPSSYSATGGATILGSGKDYRISNLASQAFFERGGKPAWIDRGAFGAVSGTSDAHGQVIYSGRREGLALYMARLLRPIWNEKVTNANATGRQESLVSDQLLFSIQRNLNFLQEFIQANQHSFNYSANELGLNRPSTEQEAWKGEATSMAQLQNLLSQTIEAINFVLFLIDYKISDVIASCDKQTQDAVARLTYCDLVTSKQGRDVARSLLNAVINQQLSYQIGLDAISETLQQRCGSFCSSDDVMQYKAMENLRKAKELPPLSKERQNCMAEALRLFDKGISNMSLHALTDVVSEFRDLRWPIGAVELPLRCAVAWDPDNLALEWRPPQRVDHDTVSQGSVATLNPYGQGVGPDHAAALKEAWEVRMRCYTLALESLELFNSAQSATSEADFELANNLRNEAWNVALTNSDATFHSRLYDWCMEKGLSDVLLNAQTPFIEKHLSSTPFSRDKLQLLWQYYVKNGLYLRAAHVLFELAKTPELSISLADRQEYLTLAVSNARSHAGSELSRHESGVEFLTIAEEHLEVAAVQVEILAEVQKLAILKGGAAALGDAWGGMELLEGTLLTISQLYELYANPLNLLDMKLLIFHVSGFHDDALIRSTWDEIFTDALVQYQSEGISGQSSALEAEVVKLASRLCPSETAFPLDYITVKLETFGLEHRFSLPPAWTPRLLMRGGVPPGDIFTALRSLYDSQVPPFNSPKALQFLLMDIALFLRDWVQEATRPHTSLSRREFPADIVDSTIERYLKELSGENAAHCEGILKEVRSVIRQMF
ncbi:related to NUP170-nuclear pore protein [Serendipita indica DSM 11827]|uniref:Related to NUP170-nuclear pore protein n=1 Tax=Serendipita indica (strain DSM 11827) TaxID=1109443 RepID=G4TIW5_SERID|nr:related to NUP170-nuclear pore protein [Serendipita indica DSM 11827]